MALERVHTGDRQLQKMQDNADRALRSLGPLIDGVLLEDVALLSGTNQVPHGLDRAPRGYIVVKQNASATFYDAGATNPRAFVALRASAPVTVSLWVF